MLPAEFEKLCSDIINNKIDQVDLSNTPLSPDLFSRLLEAFKQNSSVKKLDVSFNILGNWGVKKLLDVLENHGEIEDLSLSNNQLTQEGIMYIANFLCADKKIKKLDLSNRSTEDKNIIGDVGAEYLFKGVSVNRKLEVLKLAHLSIQECGNKEIYDAITLSHLKELDLSYNKITALTIATIATTFESKKTALTHLNLSHNAISLTGLQMLAEILKETLKSKLMVLNIEGNQSAPEIDASIEKSLKRNRWVFFLLNRGEIKLKLFDAIKKHQPLTNSNMGPTCSI